MAKAMEITFAIGAALTGSFSGAFGKAGQTLGELQRQTSSLQKVSGQIDSYQKMQGSITANQSAMLAMRQSARGLETQIAASSAQTGTYSRHLEMAQAQASRMEASLMRDRAAYEQAASKVRALKEELKSSSAPSAELQARYRAASAEAQRLKGSVTHGAQSLKVMRQRVEELKKQMQGSQTQTRTLSAEAQRLTANADRLQGRLDRDREALSRLRTELTGAGVDTRHLSDEQARLTQQSQRMADAQARLQRSQAALQETRQKLSWSNVKGDLMRAAGIGLSLGVPVAQAAEFEHAAARLNAVAFSGGGRNAEEDARSFKLLQEQARQLGRDTQFTAVQAAQSQENLARAGFKANEIISAMPGLLDMAAAEGMDLATAADIMASSLRGFGLEASDAARVSNILAQTSAASNSSIVGLGESLKYVAPVAKGLGVSIEETNAMLGIMANAGIKGSQGGTALRAAFLRLSKEPKAVAKALGQLGISARDAQGNFRELPELMQALSAKMKDMGSAQKMKYLSNIFGSEAASGMLAVMESAVDGSLQQLTRLNRESSGQLQALSKSLGISVEDLRAGMQNADKYARTLGVSFGDLSVYTAMLSKGIYKGAEADYMLTEAFSRISKKPKEVAKAMKAYGVALMDDKGRMRDFNTILTDLNASMKDMKPPDQLQALTKIFGQEGARAVQALMQGMTNGLYDQYSEIVKGATGVSQEMAQKVLSTFWGQKELAKSAISDLMITIGDVLLPSVEGIVKSFAEWTASLGKFASEHPEATKAIVGLVAGLSALNLGITAMKYAWLGIKMPFQTARVAFDIISLKALRNADTLAEAGKKAGLFSKISGKLAAGAKGIGKAFSSIGSAVGKAFSGIMNMGKSLITGLFSPMGVKILLIAGIIAAVAAAAYLIYKNWDKIKAWWNSWTLKDVFAPVIGFAQKAWSYVKGKWNDFWAWWDSWKIPNVFAILGEYIDKGIVYIKGKWHEFTDWLSSLNPFKDWTPPTVDAETVKALKAETLQKYGTLDLTPSYMRVGVQVKPEPIPKPERVTSTVPKSPNDTQAITVSAEELQRQMQDITALNAMSKGFSQRVAEMTAAWQPFKASLGEGFEQIYTVMQGVADRIRTITIPAVNELASALSRIATEIASIVQAGSLEVDVKTQTPATTETYTRTAGGLNRGGYRRHALGGIFSTPHIGLVAEAGREAVIPLEDRSRGIPLWQAAGEEMGLLLGSTTNNNDNRTNSITLTPTFNITVNGGGPGIEQRFRQIIEEVLSNMTSEAERVSFA